MRHKTLSGHQAKELINKLHFPRFAPAALQDIRGTHTFFEALQASDSCMHSSYTQGDMIVHKGSITSHALQNDLQYSYVHVPLGIILSGEILVMQNRRAIRRLLPGDFVGLFETSFFINSGVSRVLGHWSLVADTKASIVFIGKNALLRNLPSSIRFRKTLLELTRKDNSIPLPITDLVVLDTIASHITKKLLRDTIIVAHTHILPSNVALMRHLAHLVDNENLFVLEKPYSTIRSAYDHIARMGISLTPVTMVSRSPYEFARSYSSTILWNQVISAVRSRGTQRVIILEDGGDLSTTTPWEMLHGVHVVGVEQTRSGIRRLEKTSGKIPPTVSIASSGVKTHIESIFIASAVVRKISSLGVLDDAPRIGIIGSGAVGNEIKRLLVHRGMHVSMYDIADHKDTAVRSFDHLTSTDAILEASDVIIGCTGEDTMLNVPFDRVYGQKTLISASSKDIEFFSLLNRFGFAERPFETISAQVHHGLSIDILNGGYPINFDRVQEWEPAEDMQITRALMYAGLMQAIELPKEACGIHKLNGAVQKQIVDAWQKVRGEAAFPGLKIKKNTDWGALSEGV